MPSTRWRKVIRDLAAHKLRTVLVVLSIAVGVFAVGTIAGADALLQANLRDGYAASRPASATLFLAPFDRELVEVVRDMRGIADAEGRRSITVVLTTADGRDREITLNAVPDFADQRLDLVTLEQGAWPTGPLEMAVERSSLRLEPFRPGERLSIRTAAGREHELTMTGITHEVAAAPAFYTAGNATT